MTDTASVRHVVADSGGFSAGALARRWETLLLAVLVLYRAVRRLSGPAAGLIAALVLAASPATVMLNRGNVSDTLMTLLLVLAAEDDCASLIEKRARDQAGVMHPRLLAPRGPRHRAAG